MLRRIRGSRDFLPIHGIHDDDDDDCYYSYIFSSLFEKGRPKRPQSFLFGKFNFRIFNFSLSFSFTFKMSLCENSMSRTTQQHNKNNNNHNNEDINTSDYNARIRSKSQSIRVSVWALDAKYIWGTRINFDHHRHHSVGKKPLFTFNSDNNIIIIIVIINIYYM